MTSCEDRITAVLINAEAARGSALALLLILAALDDGQEGAGVTIPADELAQYARVSRRQLWELVGVLRAAGYVAVQSNTTPTGSVLPSTYCVTVPGYPAAAQAQGVAR